MIERSLSVWRHPRPRGVEGRCIGRTDVPVDARKAKRLAHRIRRCLRREEARRRGGREEGAPRTVVTSTLQRSACVGRWLKAWGWTHRVDERLDEMDFGAWDGMRWDDIGAAAVDAWCADFSHHRAGGGECVAQLLARCEAFLAARRADGPLCIVGHAGWISAATWLGLGGQGHGRDPTPADWPAAIGHGEQVAIALAPRGASA